MADESAEATRPPRGREGKGDDSIAVCIAFEGKRHRVMVGRGKGIAGLREAAARAFPECLRAFLHLHWEDEEQDAIVLSDDRDLNEAIEASKGQLLWVTVSLQAPPPTTVEPAFAGSVRDFVSNLMAAAYEFDPSTSIPTSQNAANISDLGSRVPVERKRPRSGGSASSKSDSSGVALQRRSRDVSVPWKAAVFRGVFAVPAFSLFMLPTVFFGFPVAVPYVFVHFLKRRDSKLAMLLVVVLYPFGPLIEVILALSFLVLVPIWVPIGSLLFGTSQGVGLTVILTVATRGVGLLALPVLITVSAGVWFGIGVGLSLLLLATLVPVYLVMAPLWIPLCAFAWYLLVPAFYFDLVNSRYVERFLGTARDEIATRVRGLRALYSAVSTLW